MKTKLTLLIFFLSAGLNISAQTFGNICPSATYKVNGIPFNDLEIIELFAGDTLSFQAKTYDGNLNDSVKINSNVTAVLPGATFSVDNAKQQTATVYWVPTVADASLQPYIFTLVLTDNADQIRCRTSPQISVRVNKKKQHHLGWPRS